MRTAFLTYLLVVLAGCATYGQEHHFEPSGAQPSAASASAPSDDSLATVNFFREGALLGPLTTSPAPLMYFAVDDKLVSVMPVGSNVRLSLSPGTHKFSTILIGGDWLFPLSIHRNDLSARVDMGRENFVGFVNTLTGRPLRVVDMGSAEKVLSSTRPARLIHNPSTVDAFIARLKEADAKRRASPAPSGQPGPVTSATAAALPSSEQVISVLEALATVALVAIVIASVVAGGSGGQTLPAYPTVANTTLVQPAPRGYVNQTLSPLIAAPMSSRASSGSLSEIIHSKKGVDVRNLTTGVNYRIEDGRINGTDGTRYRVIGSQVISDTGLSYRVIGDSLYSSDGRSCTKVGSLISCR